MDEISGLRTEINQIDREIQTLLDRRFTLTDRIGKIKKEHGLPVEDSGRENVILNSISGSFPDSAEEIGKIYSVLFSLSKDRQAADDD